MTQWKVALRCVLVMLFFFIAGTGVAQDFEQVTKNVEIDFPESDGVFTIRPPSGVPLPEPKMMRAELGWTELGREGRLGCTIVIQPDASPTENAAARELSAQIAFLVGVDEGPEIVTAGTPILTPVVCVLGVKPVLFDDAEMVVPEKHEGFAIKTGKWNGTDAVFVAGRDRFGVYWGVQTLKQMLFKEEAPKQHGSIRQKDAKDRVLAPNGLFADWPDVQYRMSPCPQGRVAVRRGRCNTTYLHIQEGNTLKTKEKLKEEIDNIHKLGFIGVPIISWQRLNGVLREDDNRISTMLPSREICPVADMSAVESIVTMAFEAGGDGVAVHFDDIEPLMSHHKECPICKQKFTSIADWQAFVLDSVFALAKRNGWDNRLFICCPSDYYQLQLRTDEELKKYFSELCSFPGAEAFKFFHTAFVRTDLERLSGAGFKNYAWWNNGIWPARNPELLGYDVGFPRMGYSWGLFDIDKDGMEKFFPERLAELRYLKGSTDLIFSGTGGDFGPSIGSMFAWDAVRFLFREDEYREWFVDGENGKGSFSHIRAWEWATKPIGAKCLVGGTLDKNDERRLDVANLAVDLANSTSHPRSGKISRQLTTAGLKTMEKYLATRTQFITASKDLDGVVGKRATFIRQDGCLLSIGPGTLVGENAAKPVVIENWSKADGLVLNGSTLVPAAGADPAKFSATNGKDCLLERKTLGIDVTGRKTLLIPCWLTRGTRLTATAKIDGIEQTANVSGQKSEWQDLLLPIGGENLDFFSLRLDIDPSIDNPAGEREALLRPILLCHERSDFDTLTLAQGDPLKFTEFNGVKYFRMSKNKITTADNCFALDKHSFSIDVEFIPFEVTTFKIAGTRASISPSYTGLPGWALGVCSGKITLTMEDHDRIISTVSSKAAPERYMLSHVLAVRDFENRKMRLYVNGQKVEVDEKGSGVFGETGNNLGISFDSWAGKSMDGLLRYVKVYDQVLSGDEAKTSPPTALQPAP